MKTISSGLLTTAGAGATGGTTTGASGTTGATGATGATGMTGTTGSSLRSETDVSLAASLPDSEIAFARIPEPPALNRMELMSAQRLQQGSCRAGNQVQTYVTRKVLKDTGKASP